MLGARPESLNKDEAQVWGLGLGPSQSDATVLRDW